MTVNRLDLLKNQTNITGVDYLRVAAVSTVGTGLNVRMHIHFHHTGRKHAKTILGTVTADQIQLTSVDDRLSEVLPVSHIQLSGNLLKFNLRLSRSDFRETFTFRLDHPKVDPMFAELTFRFDKACQTDVDPQPEAEVPFDDTEHRNYPVDYSGRDFSGFRRTLTEFAAQRYPKWKDRLNADTGMMLVDIMSALGDEFSYYQDRVAREAHLETATQRRSVRRHARLVDYSMHDGMAPSTWLTAFAKQNGSLPAGTEVRAEDSGDTLVYEIGNGLKDIAEERSFPVAPALNSFSPHIWDEDKTELPVGAVSMHITGKHADILTGDEPIRLLLEEADTDASKILKRCIVTVQSADEQKDFLQDKDITLITWEKKDALSVPLNLANLTLYGNIIPCSAGKTCEVRFFIGSPPPAIPYKTASSLPLSVERNGANHSTIHFFSLPGTDEAPLTRLPAFPEETNPHFAYPELLLQEQFYADGEFYNKPGKKWSYRASLIGNDFERRISSQAYDRDYTLDDGFYRRVFSCRKDGELFEHIDYASDQGATVRFGDGEFGMIPAEGTVFRALYRLGGGAGANVTRDSLTQIDEHFSDLVESIRNPLPASNGTDSETIAEAKRKAPFAYQNSILSAVIPEDCSDIARTLDWVQQAGTQFRWTGSWTDAFVTVDPEGEVTLAEDRKDEMTALLDLRRLAGRNLRIKDPVYVDLHLDIYVVSVPGTDASMVKEAILDALLGKGVYAPTGGFFSADNFTFGTPLRIAEMEAVIANLPGVHGVGEIYLERPGRLAKTLFNKLEYPVAMNEIIRIENNPAHPERGSIKTTVKEAE